MEISNLKQLPLRGEKYLQIFFLYENSKEILILESGSQRIFSVPPLKMCTLLLDNMGLIIKYISLFIIQEPQMPLLQVVAKFLTIAMMMRRQAPRPLVMMIKILDPKLDLNNLEF